MSGVDVARFLIRVYRDKKKRSIYTLKTVIIALSFRFLIYLALNQYIFKVGWLGTTPYDIAFNIIAILVYYFTLYFNVLFLSFSIEALRMKKFFMM